VATAKTKQFFGGIGLFTTTEIQVSVIKVDRE